MSNPTQTKKDRTKPATVNVTPSVNKETKIESSGSSLLNLNIIVPIITFVLFVLLLCHTLFKYGLHRYFNETDVSINTDEIRYAILKIIGVLLCIFLAVFVVYYFSSSSIMTHSFHMNDVLSLYSIQDYIYSFFFILALVIIFVLPLITKLYTPESPEYSVYVGTTISFFVCIMIVYLVVKNLKSNDANNVSKIASFIEKSQMNVFYGFVILTVAIIIPLVIFYSKLPSWVIPVVGIFLFFLIFTISTFPQLTNGMDKNMEWFPKSILDKIVYSVVFLPLRMLYYYPYLFINYIIPTIFSLFLSSSIFIYTITFIVGLLVMKYVLPYFNIDLNKKVFLLWLALYFVMIVTNSFIKSKTTFFTMRQGFLFVCLFLVFLASSFVIQKSASIPEYLKLYISFFIIITSLIASFLFFYMINIDYGKEFTDCNIFKPLINQTASTDEKVQGMIPILRKILFAYIGICISCYIIVTLSNKFFPIQQGTIGYIFSIIIVLLISMIIISVIKKIVSRKTEFNVPSSFVNFLLSLASFIFELIFYIPCKLHDMISYTSESNQKINKTTIVFIILDIIFILLYVYGDYIRKHIFLNGVVMPGNVLSTIFPNISGSNVNLKFPISIKEYDMDVSNVVATSTDASMNNTDRTIYNYSISFWFYIDTNNPNTSMAYSKYTPIFSYGTTPVICYNYMTQSFIVATKSDNVAYPVLLHSDMNDNLEKYKNSGLRIIYETKNIPLQKWNNLIIIYNSSRVDIFINGGLVKANAYLSPSPPHNIHNPDIPQIINLVAGYSNGIKGRLCNVIYYDKKIGLYDVNRLYESVKDNNPPIFYPSII